MVKNVSSQVSGNSRPINQILNAYVKKVDVCLSIISTEIAFSFMGKVVPVTEIKWDETH